MCEKEKLLVTSNFPFHTMFSTLCGTYFPFNMLFKMSSAICFSLDQSRILSSGNELSFRFPEHDSYHFAKVFQGEDWRQHTALLLKLQEGFHVNSGAGESDVPCICTSLQQPRQYSYHTAIGCGTSGRIYSQAVL